MNEWPPFARSAFMGFVLFRRESYVIVPGLVVSLPFGPEECNGQSLGRKVARFSVINNLTIDTLLVSGEKHLGGEKSICKSQGRRVPNTRQDSITSGSNSTLPVKGSEETVDVKIIH